MLVYAIEKKSMRPVNVNEVQNGKDCGCFCPECKDDLIAKNNCTEMSNHFAHQNFVESRACLMTQLHTAAQYYFLSLEEVLLPEVSFLHDGTRLSSPEQTVQVNSSQREATVGKYFADVLLATSVGVIVIEVAVTHYNEEQKTKYYIDNCIGSLEYDLGDFRDLSVDEALSLLRQNKIPNQWLYPWSKMQLIELYEAEKLQREHETFKRNRDSAKRAVKKILSSRTLTLPSVAELVQCVINEKKYKRTFNIFQRESLTFDLVEVYEEAKGYLVLKCTKLSKKGNSRTLFAAYYYTLNIPQPIIDLEGAVIIRKPSPAQGKPATWSWLKFPKIKFYRAQAEESFKLQCEKKYQWERYVESVEGKIEQLSEGYERNTNYYFKRDYGKWKQWLIDNQLFHPATPGNPRLPKIFNPKGLQQLWMFDAWHYLIISVLAEIVDRTPLTAQVDIYSVFHELTINFGVKKEFTQNEKLLATKQLNYTTVLLLCRNTVIGYVLDGFVSAGKLTKNGNEYTRIGSLIQALRPK
ncbi:MAG: hypothetical protein ACPGUD_05215 [Parashewanella sp.]